MKKVYVVAIILAGAVCAFAGNREQKKAELPKLRYPQSIFCVEFTKPCVAKQETPIAGNTSFAFPSYSGTFMQGTDSDKEIRRTIILWEHVGSVSEGDVYVVSVAREAEDKRGTYIPESSEAVLFKGGRKSVLKLEGISVYIKEK